MTMKEIETKYHINHRTIKKYIDKKAFLATKTSKSWNIDEDTFQEWFKLYKSGYENKQPWNRKIFNTIDSPEKAYWLGFINADGCIHEKAQYVSIDIGGRDREHLQKFVSFIDGKNELIKTTIHSQTGNELVHVALCNSELISDLKRYGIHANKSGKEQYIETNYDADFIRGLVDGDGCILNSLKGIDLVGSYQLLSSVQNKFLSLIQVTPHKIMTHGKIFKISYRSKGEVYKIIKFLYGENSVSLARKQELANKIIQNYEKLC